MVTTVKFSAFAAAGEPEIGDITVGLKSGVNTKYVLQWAFYPPGPTIDRPDLPEIGPLRFNTDIDLYEYWNGTEWTQLGTNTSSGTVLPGLQYELAYYPGDGNFVAGLTTIANGILKTDSDSFPSISQTLPTEVQGNITRTGIVASGTWRATPIQLAYGGTNANLTASDGGVVYSTSSELAILPDPGAIGKVLQSPAHWSTSTYADLYDINTILYASAANTVTGLPTENSAMLVTSSIGLPSYTASMTDGQVVIGSTGATPVPNTLTAGTGVSITNGAGSITITATTSPGEISFEDVTSATKQMDNNFCYRANSASILDFTLPLTSSPGDTIEVIGEGAGGWTVGLNTGQSIRIGSSITTVSTGSISSSNRYDSIKIRCTVADTEWAHVGGPQSAAIDFI